MIPRFTGKAAFVTGGSSGIGRAICLALAREGAAVAVVGRNNRGIDDTISLMGADGGRAAGIVADLRNAAEATRAVEDASRTLGGIDLVVNAAGILRVGALDVFPEEDWDAVFDTNVKVAYLVCRAAIPELRSRGGGAIVNIASVYAFASSRGTAAYSASKAALVSLTKTMALDHVDEQIRINGIAPGPVETPMLRNFAASASPDDPRAVLTASERLQPNGRLTECGEVADLAVYLLSKEAEAIVGSVIVIDGGRLAKLGST